MLISYAHRFIFIKTVKTAGTSVEGFLEPLCTPPGHVVKHHTPTLISVEGVVARRGPERPESDQGFYNHMSAAEIQARFADFPHYRRFSVVRDPYDRAVSWFHFRGERTGGTEGLTLAQAQDLLTAGQAADLRAQFADFVQQHGVPQDERVLAIEGKLAVDRWLRFECLASDLERLSADWKLPVPVGGVSANLPRFKVIRQDQVPAVSAYLSRDAVKAINEINRWSFDHFQYEYLDPNSFVG